MAAPDDMIDFVRAVGRETVHVWASPDPDEIDPDDPLDRFKTVCTPATPWKEAPSIAEKIFHPHSYIDGVDYVCSVCGTRTNREPK